MSEQLRSLQRWFRARPRRLTRVKYGLIALALLMVMALAARPIVHSIKSWQARKLAAEANTLMQNQQWREATRKALDAAKLRPNEPAALEAVAHLLSRTGQSAAA